MLTGDFKDTIRERARRDPEFRAALRKEALDLLRAGDHEVGQAVLRDYLEATKR